MKKLLTLVLIACAVVAYAPHSADARVDMEDFIIALPNGVNLNVRTYSAVEQFVVNYDNVEFTMPERSRIILESMDGYFLANSKGAHAVCGIDRSRLDVEIHPGEPTVVLRVTPSNPKCSFNGGGAENWVTEGGSNPTPVGGGGAPGTTDLGSSGSPSTGGTLATGQTTTGQTLALAPRASTSLPIYVRVSPIIRRNLAVGASGEDVKRLQALLNADPDTRVATSGPGAPGNETGIFFAATRRALEKFQQKWGLGSLGSLGYLDAGTRTKLPAMFVNISTTTTPAPRGGLPTTVRATSSNPTTTPSSIPPQDPVRWWQFWRWFR